MSRILIASILLSHCALAASISGQVTTQGGQGVANARVWVEAGLGSTLLELQTGADGSFNFDSLPSGLLGVFAYADGYAFGGASISVGPDDDITGTRIPLGTSGEVSGRVVDARGKPIASARVTRERWSLRACRPLRRSRTVWDWKCTPVMV